MENGPVIQADSLVKKYGNLRALNNVKLMVPRGAVGLLGPNGAGKSTLIKCLLGLVTPTLGSSSVLGNPSSSFNKGITARELVGYVPENDCLEPEMTAISFVRYMGELSGLPSIEAMQRAHEVLDYVGIEEQRYRYIGTYSTGMKQKVKLAQAIVHDPQLIILDEPTNGMDPKGRQEMLSLIRDISRNHGKNILLSSHLLPDVEYICDHVVIMNQGKVLITGDLEELTRPSDTYEIRIKGNGDTFQGIISKMGIKFEKKGTFYYLENRDNLITDLYKGVRGTGIQIRHATKSRMTLEEIFVSNIQGAVK